jgi:hypothetical protein
VHPVTTNDVLTTESWQHNHTIQIGGNTICNKACPEAEVALLPLDLLPFGQQPNGRTYLAFKFHKNTTWTAINDDNLGLNTATNKWKKKGISFIHTVIAFLDNIHHPVFI